MKVYVVAFDYGHEGYGEPVRVFSDKQKADDWAEKAKNESMYQIRIFESDLDADNEPTEV